ncbi:MAG: hypothetical protein JNL13_00255 [Chitinophagaceae bacterium]|nr:hypothetical protein [Chitinophagaceae bacterium]
MMEHTSTIAGLDIGQSFSKAWKATKENIWLLAGFTVVYYIAYFILAMIPFVGGLAGFFSFIFGASVFAAYHIYEKKGSLEFSDFFSWSPRFSRLFLGHLLAIGISLLFLIPLVIAFVAFIGFSAIGAAISNPEDIMSLFGPGFAVFLLLMLLLGVLFAVWLFAYPYLVQFTDMPLTEALRLSWKIGRNNIGQLILFLVLAIALTLLGAMLLLIGLAVTTPLIMGVQFYFLRSIFPEQQEPEQWDFMNQPSPME